MSVSSLEFLDSAKSLLPGLNEIDWRNATSRAYYSAYHSALEVVDLCPGNANHKMGSHERLSERFSLHPAKGAKSIAVVLQSMKRFRHIADYEISDPFEHSIATNQIAQCAALRDRLVAFENTHGPLKQQQSTA